MLGGSSTGPTVHGSHVRCTRGDSYGHSIGSGNLVGSGVDDKKMEPGVRGTQADCIEDATQMGCPLRCIQQGSPLSAYMGRGAPTDAS